MHPRNFATISDVKFLKSRELRPVFWCHWMTGFGHPVLFDA